MRKVVVFSGAGISQESGIPTFRDSADGLWEKYRIEEVATPEGWKADPNKVLEFYDLRWKTYRNCKPNAAHLAFKKLEQKYEVIHLTQNIDDLLEQAGCSDVRHIHGKLTERKCEWHNDILVESEYTCDYVAPQTEMVKMGELCEKCGGQLRPNVVWFGEMVHFDFKSIADLSLKMAQTGGVFICVGTSLQVYPAAGIVPMFSKLKNRYKFIVDKDKINPPDFNMLEGTACEQVPKLVEDLLKKA